MRQNVNQNKKVLILGASGMLGSMLVDVFAKSCPFEITATVRTKNIIEEFQKKYQKVNFAIFNIELNTLENLLVSAKPDWIVNAIGIIKPFIHDKPEEIQNAIKINALFPYTLANGAKKINAKVIQIATDCVFSGKIGNYNESDPYDTLDVYGKTKSLGEIHMDNFYNLRCSIIGPEIQTKNSLLEWILRQPKNARLNGFTNHSWNGLTTLQFAKICQGIISNDLKPVTIQHIIPKDTVTKDELLRLSARFFNRGDILIQPVSAKESINRTLQTSYGKMNQLLWEKAGYPKIPTIAQMLEELATHNS